MAEEAQQLLLNQFKDAVNGLTTRAVTDDGNEIFTLRHPLVHRVAVTLLQVRGCVRACALGKKGGGGAGASP